LKSWKVDRLIREGKPLAFLPGVCFLAKGLSGNVSGAVSENVSVNK
jgi:hypothetical protein